MSDKIVKREGGIVPADDFAQRVDEALRKRGEEPAERKVADECPYAFKFEENAISRCQQAARHDGPHQNGMVFWNERCPSEALGERCRYQRWHIGAHMDVREEQTWTDDKPAVVGDGVPSAFDILGDTLKASPAFQQALANKIAGKAPILRRVPLQKARPWSVNFGPETIPAGQRRTFTWESDALFRGENLVNTGDEDGLYIENIVVGTRNQMPAGTSGVSAMMFRETSLGSGIMMDTATPGTKIAIVVRNAATDPRTFSATIYGKAVV